MTYIYNLIWVSAAGKVEFLQTSTKKHTITHFISQMIEEGASLAGLTIVRSRDGRALSATFIDVYDFMELEMDRGEL